MEPRERRGFFVVSLWFKSLFFRVDEDFAIVLAWRAEIKRCRPSRPTPFHQLHPVVDTTG